MAGDLYYLPHGKGLTLDAVEIAPTGPAPACDPSDGRGEARDALMCGGQLGDTLPSRPARAAANNASAMHGMGNVPEDNAADGDIDMQRSCY
jgi:hypothetical protein